MSNQIVELPSNSSVVPIGTYVPTAPEAATTTNRGSITLSGDLGGVADTPAIVTNTVAKWNAHQLQGLSISTSTPSNEQALKWNSSTLVWEPGTFLTSLPDATAGVKGVIRLANDLGGTALLPTVTTNTVAKWNADKLQGRSLATTAPTNGQALKYNTTTLVWEPGTFITTLPDATTTAKGIVQLAGDLGGTALAPTVTTNTTAKWNANLLQSRAVATTAPTNGQALKFNTTTNQWEPGDVATQSATVSDATTTTKGIVQLSRDFGGTATAPLVVGLQSRNVSNVAPTDGQALVWDNANNTWKPGTAGATGGGATDATTTTKGIIKLAGDLGGTADLPVVGTNGTAKWNANQIQSIPIDTTAPTDTQVLTYVSANSRAEWRTMTSGSGGTATPPTNIVEVAATGGNFTSIQAAITFATAGQTVVVYPGIYNEILTLKNGVNLHLVTGCKIRYTGTATTPMVSDGATAVTCQITGYGELEQAASGATKGEAFKLGVANSDITLYCKTIKSTGESSCISQTAVGFMRIYCDLIDCAATGIPAVYCAAGNQFIQGRDILGAGATSNSYAVQHFGGTQSVRAEYISRGVSSIANSTGTQIVEARLIYHVLSGGVVRSLGGSYQHIKNSKILCSSANTSFYCVEKNSTTTNLRLQNCQLVSGQYSVYSSVANSPVPLINDSCATSNALNIVFQGGTFTINSVLT